MTMPGLIFYGLAAVVLLATLLAVTRQNLVHAAVQLAISFVGTALLFYLLGAPLLAALEVIIYAGGIMVLFVFIVLTLAVPAARRPAVWLPAAALAGALFVLMAVLLYLDPLAGKPLPLAMSSPAEFGRYVFDKYWLPVEVVSFLLFAALAGAWYLGRAERGEGGEGGGGEEGAR
ncbi:MAG: NADH-quinone oxidoreductase subunit J [Deltaproteobacteria bacterium]|nr:NADH-quinone oxidoreductase subunit J [Deltaproteobacteria bacterium]